MNKKLIALAVAAGVAAPMSAAQAGPTVYGALQAEIASVSNDGYGENNCKGQRSCIATNESGLKVKDNKRGRLGIKGDEDLGGGLKAIYKFEWQVDTTVANVSDGDREAFVGLKGGFGAITVGRLKSPYKYTGGVKYDPFVTTYLEARKSGGMSGGDFGHNGFLDNNLGYTGKFGMVKIGLNLGLDEGTGVSGPGTDGNSGDIVASLAFGQKNWEAFVAMANDEDTDGDATTGNDAQESIKVGGKFSFGNNTITAQYETVDPDGNNNDDEYMFLGYQLKLGKGSLVAQLG
jgi:predicted porin